MSLLYSLERKVALEVVELASKLTLKVCNNIQAITKEDKSPVTVADYGSQALINLKLHQHFPNDKVVGEEDSDSLRTEAFKPIRQEILDLVNNSLDDKVDEEQLLAAIDRGNYEGGSKGRFWTLDPIDGTKGFLRGEQFAVCLALIVDGIVQLGVIGCPNLTNPKDQAGRKGRLFVAVKGQGAYQRFLGDTRETQIQMNSLIDLTQAKVCESVEAAHSKHDDTAKILNLLNISTHPLRMDSQAKYCSIAAGDADIYLRLPTSKTYVEKIWDHASGNLLVSEAGGKVTDILGNSLNFGKGRTLLDNKGVIATPSSIHKEVLEAAQKVLQI